jgi:hypothetical protein
VKRCQDNFRKMKHKLQKEEELFGQKEKKRGKEHRVSGHGGKN